MARNFDMSRDIGNKWKHEEVTIPATGERKERMEAERKSIFAAVREHAARQAAMKAAKK